MGVFSSLGEIDRRTFVKLGGLSVAALVFGTGLFTQGTRVPPRFSDYPFSLGVASGDPLPDGVVLWTRLAPDPLNGGGMPDGEVAVRWQVARDEGFRQVVRQGIAHARPEWAHSVHVEVEGLEPAREYFYRFYSGLEASPVGRTKTAPAAGDPVSALTFAFASCQHYEHGYYAAYRRMVEEEDLDLVMHLGDYIYEYGAGEDVSSPSVRFHDGPEVLTLDGYRDRHALYRADEDLQAAHAAFPWVVTWDDHEAENNYADEVSEDGVEPERFLKRRAAAYQAYYEHMPLRSAAIPQGSDMQMFRRLTYGDLVEFNVLDTSQYRDDQANGDGSKPPNPGSNDPSRTLMGTEQERWLMDGLDESGARWNVLAQQTFFARRDSWSGDGLLLSMDAWDGYPATRDRILDYVDRRGVENLVVIGGNVHANWAAEILADFDDPDSLPLGTEFVGTSISSGGDGHDTDPEAINTMAENPHIKFYNNQRGYVRCRVTPETWQTDYRVLPYVTQPGAPITTRESLTVEAGNPRL